MFWSHDRTLMTFEMSKEERPSENIKHAEGEPEKAREPEDRDQGRPSPRSPVQSIELNPVICNIHTEQVVPISLASIQLFGSRFVKSFTSHRHHSMEIRDVVLRMNRKF